MHPPRATPLPAAAVDPLDSIDSAEPVKTVDAPAPPEAPVRAPESRVVDASPRAAAPPDAAPPAADTYSFLEVAGHLQISPDTLQAWNHRFGAYLPSNVAGDSPRYTSADVAVLLAVRALLAQGQSDTQIKASLIPRRIVPPPEPALQAAATTALNSALTTAMTLASQRGQGEQSEGSGAVTHAIGDVLSALAGGQQTVLNSQASMREMVSVVVQDNFNLKDENRKLRERMLELERALAEYQRREETRKERYEARLRALEGTVAALQQQMAQFVQHLRAQQKKRGWW